MTELNLNNVVKFKMTATGMQMLKEQHELLYGTRKPFKQPLADADGCNTMALWDLMNTFGSKMFIGNANLPIETRLTVVK
jgi:hypothetical protein